MSSVEAVWAIDPIEGVPEIDTTILQHIAAWSYRHRVFIKPVYVFTPITQVEALAVETLRGRMAEYLAQAHVEMKEPEILIHPAQSVTDSVQILHEYVKQRGAKFIIVCSHGRRGLQRLLFGSFAERLLHVSEMPILFLNRKSAGADPSRILFATTFSPESERAYVRLLRDFGGLFREVVIFNDLSVCTELSMVTPLGVCPFPPDFDYVEAQREISREAAASWITMAEEAGIRAVFAQATDSTTIVESISESAQSFDVGAIAMSSEIGPLGALLIGSNARDLIRASSYPLFVYGPRACDSEVTDDV